MQLGEARRLLRKIKEIKYSKHAEIRCKQRNIDKNLIKEHILNPDKLVKIVHQPALKGEIKLKLYFELSNARTLIIVSLIERESLYIITSVIRIRKWQEGIEKWYRKH